MTQEKPPLLDRFIDRVFEGATSGRLTARRALAAIIILTTAVTVLAGLGKKVGNTPTIPLRRARSRTPRPMLPASGEETEREGEPFSSTGASPI